MLKMLKSHQEKINFGMLAHAFHAVFSFQNLQDDLTTIFSNYGKHLCIGSSELPVLAAQLPFFVRASINFFPSIWQQLLSQRAMFSTTTFYSTSK